MRLALLLGLAGILLAGCAGKKLQPAPGGGAAEGGRPAPAHAASTNKPAIIVTPGTVVAGKIAFVNTPSGFVILTFPLGTMPPAERRLNVYRQGLKVAELKVGKEQIDVNTVADILIGECRAGDEVRED